MRTSIPCCKLPRFVAHPCGENIRLASFSPFAHLPFVRLAFVVLALTLALTGQAALPRLAYFGGLQGVSGLRLGGVPPGALGRFTFHDEFGALFVVRRLGGEQAVQHALLADVPAQALFLLVVVRSFE